MAHIPLTEFGGVTPWPFFVNTGMSHQTLDTLRILQVFDEHGEIGSTAPVTEKVVAAIKILLNKLGRMKLVEFKDRPSKTTLVKIKPVYVFIREVQLAIQKFIDDTRSYPTASIGLNAVLQGNEVLENLYTQVLTAMRALDTYTQEVQEGTVPQMQLTEVKAQLAKYQLMLEEFKKMHITTKIFMQRPDGTPMSKWGLHKSLRVLVLFEKCIVTVC